MDRRTGEPGSATVAVALAMVALTMMAALLFQLVRTVGERSDARNAADLTAVSAAIVYRDTGSVQAACARATELTEGYDLTCAAEGEAIRVTLRRQASYPWITQVHEVSALAGPARGP